MHGTPVGNPSVEPHLYQEVGFGQVNFRDARAPIRKESLLPGRRFSDSCRRAVPSSLNGCRNRSTRSFRMTENHPMKSNPLATRREMLGTTGMAALTGLTGSVAGAVSQTP